MTIGEQLRKSLISIDSILFDHNDSQLNIIYRTVTASGSRTLDHLYDIKTFLYLSKHSILSVKMRNTTDGRVNAYLLVGKTGMAYTFFCFRGQTVLQLL